MILREVLRGRQANFVGTLINSWLKKPLRRIKFSPQKWSNETFWDEKTIDWDRPISSKQLNHFSHLKINSVVCILLQNIFSEKKIQKMKGKKFLSIILKLIILELSLGIFLSKMKKIQILWFHRSKSFSNNYFHNFNRDFDHSEKPLIKAEIQSIYIFKN